MGSDKGIRICVCQLGARMHYGAARSFERWSELDMLITDICGVKGWPRLLRTIPQSLCPSGVKRLLGRNPIGIPSEKIVMFSRLGLEYQWRLSRCRTQGERIQVHLQIGKRFGEEIVYRGFKGATHVYTFSSAGLEVLKAARSLGLHTVVEQPSAANEVEQEIMREEHARYPGWEANARCDKEQAAYAERQRREWDLADQIIVPSKFVAASLEQVGVSPERCVTVPYGVSDSFGQIVRKKHIGPLRVLTVGGVRLQKGPQYICDAAKKLGKNFDFRLVGVCSFSETVKHDFAETIHLAGPVPRSEISEHFEWADVFLFPSLCDGFGIVLLEALAAGLPIITTPNTGVAIRDGVDGFIVPIRDANAIAERLDQLASNSVLLAEMSINAKKRSETFTLNAYSDRLYHAMVGVR